MFFPLHKSKVILFFALEPLCWESGITASSSQATCKCQLSTGEQSSSLRHWGTPWSRDGTLVSITFPVEWGTEKERAGWHAASNRWASLTGRAPAHFKGVLSSFATQPARKHSVTVNASEVSGICLETWNFSPIETELFLTFNCLFTLIKPSPGWLSNLLSPRSTNLQWDSLSLPPFLSFFCSLSPSPVPSPSLSFFL